MPPSVATDDETHVKYTTNSTSDRTIYDTMKAEGIFLLHKDHLLAGALPDCMSFNVGNANQVGVSMHLLTFLSVPFFKFSFEALDQHIGWALSAPRLSKWFASLKKADLDWSPTSPETLRKRISTCLPSIPADELKIVLTDYILISGALPDCDSGSFYDHVYGRQLMRKSEDASLLAEAKLLMPCHYRKEDRQAHPFDECIQQVLSLLRAGTAAQSEKAQAAEFVRMLRATRSSPGFEIYVEFEDAAEEIARRLAPTESERFAPLFDSLWRSKFKNLAKVLKHPISGSEARSIVSTLLVALDHGENVVLSAVSALEPALNDYVAMLEASDYASKSNAERAHVVRAAYKAASGKRASGDTAGEPMSSEASATLYSNPAFKELRQRAEECGGDDPVKLAGILLTSTNAAGVLFMSGKNINQEFWRQLTAVRSDAVLASYFNSSVCFDSGSEARHDWGIVMTDATIKKLMTGKYTYLDIWGMLLPVIEKREGRFVTAALSKDPATFWSDSSRLDLATEPWKRLLAALGYGGREEGSAVWLMHHIKLMAHSIDSLPDGLAQKPGLKIRLQLVAEAAIREFASAWRVTIATPMDAAVRQRLFVSGEGLARPLIEQVQKRTFRFREEVEDGLHGISVDPAMNKLSGEKRFASEGYYDHSYEANAKQQRTSTEPVWGAAASRHGLYKTNDALIFGHHKVPFTNASLLKDHCIACFAGGPNRDSWCPNPQACWSSKGASAHSRVEGYPDSACKYDFVPRDIEFDRYELKNASASRNLGIPI